MNTGNRNPLALIIEDDPDAATIFSAALKAAGFEIEIIATGDKALERLTATKPAVVVLDMHLPNVEGSDILHYIRTNTRLAGTQVIIITGDRELANDPLLQEREVVQILVKPVTYKKLRDLAHLLKLQIGG